MKLCKKYLVLGLLGSVVASGGAYAATQSVTANMTFDSALSLTKTSDINFGIVQGSTAGSYTITTAGAVSTVGGTIIGGTPTAGAISVVGSTTQLVTVGVNSSYVADHGVTLSAATCSWNNAAAAACDTPITGLSSAGVGKTLKVGVTATSDGTATAGTTATPSFTVTVVYG